MQKISKISEISNIKDSVLRSYIYNKSNSMMKEYNLSDITDIGVYVLLNHSEIQKFNVNEMEFVEVLEISGNMYLHGVKISGDSYGEDIYMPVEVVKC